MKDTLLVPVVLILTFLVCSIIIAAFVFLSHTDSSAVPRYLGPIVLSALGPAILLTFLRSFFRRIVSIAAVVLVLITTAALLVATVFIDEMIVRPRVGDGGVTNPLPTGVILHGDEYSIRIGQAEGASLEDVLVFRRRSLPRVVPVESAVWNGETLEIVSRDPAADLRLSAEHLSGVRMDGAPASITSVARDITSVYTVLRGTFRGGMNLDFVIYAAAFILAIGAVWTPARLFRWPLLNALIALAFLRGIFAVPRLAVAIPLTNDFFQFLPPFVGTYRGPILWVVLAIVAFVVATILPPLSRWRREMFGDEGTR